MTSGDLSLSEARAENEGFVFKVPNFVYIWLSPKLTGMSLPIAIHRVGGQDLPWVCA